MKIYNYDSNTHEFLFESDGRENPKEKGKYLLPANATFKKPPKKEGDFTQVFNGNNWVLKEKHVGTFYNKETLRPVSTTIIGDIPEYLTILKPSTQWDKWEIDKWVTVKNIYYYKLQDQIWVLDSTKEQELKQAMKDIYDVNIKNLIQITTEDMILNIIDSTTESEFDTLLFNFRKTQALYNATEKDKLDNKTMQELMNIYNSLTA